MTQKQLSQVTALIFAVTGIMHLYRLVTGGQVTFMEWEIPMWASIVGVVVAGYLAWQHSKLIK